MKMRLGLGILMLAAVVAGNTLVWAGSDDVKWINQCIKDNKDEGAKDEVVKKYCTCMNNKMSDNETLSISEWEKTHAKERVACEKESGWK